MKLAFMVLMYRMLVIGHIANHTSKIRVGAGGIMLPNHSTLMIAEQFGTLEAMYPNRIDLGFQWKDKGVIYVSAKEGTGFLELQEQLEQHLFYDDVEAEFLFPYSAGELVAYFQQHADVLEVKHDELGTYMKVLCRQKDFKKYKQLAQD